MNNFDALSPAEQKRVLEGTIDYLTRNLHKDQTFGTYIPTGSAEQQAKQLSILERLKNHPDEWYIFSGNPGTGKNHMANALVYAKVIRKLQDYGADKSSNFALDASLISCQELFSKIRATYTDSQTSEDDIIEYYSTKDVLVLNEVGRSKNSEFEKNILFRIIDYRIEHNLQTIIITNSTPQELTINLDNTALADRILGRARPIIFDWGSYRPFQFDTREVK